MTLNFVQLLDTARYIIILKPFIFTHMSYICVVWILLRGTQLVLYLVATVSTHAGNPHFLFKFKRYVHVKVCVYLRSIWLISRRERPSVGNPEAGECNKFSCQTRSGKYTTFTHRFQKIKLKYISWNRCFDYILGLVLVVTCLWLDIGWHFLFHLILSYSFILIFLIK